MDRDVEPLLRAVQSDRDPLVRRWAALALEREAGCEERAALRQALAGEPDPVVRHVLERALRRSERPSS